MSPVAAAGSRLRWAALAVVIGVAIVAAVAHRARRLPWGGLYVAGFLFTALALASGLWSVDRRLTWEQGAAFAVLLAAAAAAGVAVTGRPRGVEQLLAGLLAGALAVMVASLVLLFVDFDTSIYDATATDRARLEGFAQSPNQLAMVAALALPLAAWAAFRSRGTLQRLAGAAVGFLLVLVIVGADSDGAYAAGLVGLLVTVALAPVRPRHRLAAAAAGVAIFAGGYAVGQLGARDRPSPAPSSSAKPRQALDPRTYPQTACIQLPPDDVGQPRCGKTGVAVSGSSFFSSGRTDAWRGALRQAERRPILGYGFGTENHAFIDRYTYFEGSYLENSYLGVLLQLGAAGLAVFLSIFVAAAYAAARVLRSKSVSARASAAASAGVVAGGLVLGFSQSYLYSAGNIVTFSFWLSAALLAASTPLPRTAKSLGKMRYVAPAAIFLVALAAAIPLGRWERSRFRGSMNEGLEHVSAAAGPLAQSSLSHYRFQRGLSCLVYERDRDDLALELCFDRSGRLLEAVDRRGGGVRRWSLESDPGGAAVRVDPHRVTAAWKRLRDEAIASAKRRLEAQHA